MRSLMPLGLLALTLAPAPAMAQGPWSVLVSGGALAFSPLAKATVEDVSEAEGFEASSTTQLRVAVERELGTFRVRLAYGYAETGFGSSGEVRVILLPALTLREGTLQVGYRVLQLGSGATASVRAGPLMHAWSGDALGDTRIEWGAQGGVTLDATIARHLTLVADATLGVTPSFTRDDELDELNISYERTPIWSRALALGLRYRF